MSDTSPLGAPTIAPPSSIRAAIAQRIANGSVQPSGGTNLLDFILVLGSLSLLAGGLYGLFEVKDISDKTLPIIASILSFICGSVLGAYAGYRWGASVTAKRAGSPA